MPMALAGPHPPLFRHDHRHRFIHNPDFDDCTASRLDPGSSIIAVLFGILLDLADHLPSHRFGIIQEPLQTGFLGPQFTELLLDFDRFKPGQLAQPDLQNVFSLALAEPKALDQRRFRFVGCADRCNHLVDRQQHQLPAFENVNPIVDLVQPMAGSARDGGDAKATPLTQNFDQCLLAWPAIDADHHQIAGNRRLQTGVGEQDVDEIVLRQS